MTSILAELLSSRTRAEVLRILFGLEMPEIHIREITRRSGVTVRSVQGELKRLQRLELIIVRRDGNRLYYKANTNHPLFSTLRSLVLKTIGLADALARRLTSPDIRLAFVFGSIAEGKEKTDSDVDLFVVGNIGLRALSAKFQDITEEIGREVNPFVINVEEFRRRLNSNDHFLTRVMAAPKLFIIGGENELKAMGR